MGPGWEELKRRHPTLMLDGFVILSMIIAVAAGIGLVFWSLGWGQ